ncbi:rhodanese-like domain-containing protein [Lacipirellula parvula]|uniref:Rhodanese-related sulfurtransferase n=1 Tax=Lacipirellula parvula TaxID=2650471 RepID=A0A5K7XHH5_9BACT|nr:rhodanese-like domain-containing protein [Lacipirellula parvula]BBO35898.1 rhodanese-related sulfurtransferase [Lacipirellula parvula]
MSSAQPPQNLPPAEVEQRRRAGQPVPIIDVRTPAEFRGVHAEGAQNIPIDELASRVDDLRQQAAAGPLYLICQGGGRSRRACEQLAAQGFAVVNIDGGTNAWGAAGLPVVRGKATISLERQVRIAAGSLALTGALLAWFVHPAFAWLSAFIGAGLVFAGVTDTCGMGMVLAKMPWNRS